MQAFSIEHLVLDAAPLLSTAASSSASSLRGLAQNFLTTPDVVSEIRDKTSRELFTATLQVLGLDTQDNSAEYGGLQIREATAEAVLKGLPPKQESLAATTQTADTSNATVTAFAKLTGGLGVLSEADIRVLALTYALEVEKNGTRRLRPAPGKLSPEEQDREAKKQERIARQKLEGATLQDQVENAPASSDNKQDVSETASTITRKAQNPVEGASTASTTGGSVSHDDQMDDQMEMKTQASESAFAGSTAASGAANEDSDEDGGEWITPSNVTLHKSRDLGLFPSLPAAGPSAYTDGQGARKAKAKTVLKVACLTGDYAMQNVALQMGLNVFGVGGKKVKEVRTWVLRCHACFK